MDSPVTAVITTAVITTASAAVWAFRRRRGRGHEDWPVGMQPVDDGPPWGEK